MLEPVFLASDFTRHEPASVRIVSSLGHRYSQYVLSSRCVRRDGMIVEIVPPVTGTFVFRLEDFHEFRVKLPHQDGSVALTGGIEKFVPLGQDSEGKRMSLAVVKFAEISSEARQALEAHELTVAARGTERSPRISVRFPVELAGMDVMSPLTALDLSMTGMFVSGRARFSPGKLLTLQFRLPFEARNVVLRGKVVWTGGKRVAGASEVSHGFGVQFVEPPPVARAVIASYYARNTITPQA
jgi:Tfp pilus assembly protein PilZ